MKENVNPIGLKGHEVTDRMKELMGITHSSDNRKISSVELTKMGPDGNVYGIVRENHEYYIKITPKKNSLLVEDFAYIGGLQNKKQEAYGSYAKALKHLNLKFHSLNEAYGKSGQINVFEDDNLLIESDNMVKTPKSKCCDSDMDENGVCVECKGGVNESTDEIVEELNELELAVEGMLERDNDDNKIKGGRLSISKSIDDLNESIKKKN